MPIDKNVLLVQALFPDAPESMLNFQAAPSLEDPLQMRIDRADDLMIQLAELAIEFDPTGDLAQRIGGIVEQQDLFVIGPWPPIITKPKPKPKSIGGARGIGPWPPIATKPPAVVAQMGEPGTPASGGAAARGGADAPDFCPHCGKPLR